MPNPQQLQSQLMQRNLPKALTSRPASLSLPRMTLAKPAMNTPLNSPQAKVSAKALMTQASSLPLGVPAFKRLPAAEAQMKKVSSPDTFVQSPMTILNATLSKPTRLQQIYDSNKINEMVYSNIKPVPPFQGMPDSVARISTGPEVETNGNRPEVQALVDRPTQTITESHSLPHFDLRGYTLEELAAAANVNITTIKAAIEMRQRQLIEKQEDELMFMQQLQRQQQHLMATQTTSPTTRTTTATTQRTSTTLKPSRSKYPVAVSGHKVMNAPKEYYPVGYDKNYDDNFVSKVDLPPTNFHCGDQKHFPGLYGDEDLGCMVFHVCALTDDGLIMKSFLCPESTLFDQTILKCNWWFYVECKSSRQLYDSNLPVSKSYQLMKALSFFSKYKNNQAADDETPGGVDLEALKNSVSSESL